MVPVRYCTTPQHDRRPSGSGMFRLCSAATATSPRWHWPIRTPAPCGRCWPKHKVSIRSTGPRARRNDSDQARDAQGLIEVMAQRSDRDRQNPITLKSIKARELDREPIRGFPSGPGASRAAIGRIHDCILDRTTIIKTLAPEGASIHERYGEGNRETGSMNIDRQAEQPGPHSPARIWYQSVVDPDEQRP